MVGYGGGEVCILSDCGFTKYLMIALSERVHVSGKG